VDACKFPNNDIVESKKKKLYAFLYIMVLNIKHYAPNDVNKYCGQSTWDNINSKRADITAENAHTG